MHVVEQTRDEKIAMYLKLTKRELAEMLFNCNEALGLLHHSVRQIHPDLPLLPNQGTWWGPPRQSAT